jgi:hypothetical protein
VLILDVTAEEAALFVRHNWGWPAPSLAERRTMGCRFRASHRCNPDGTIHYLELFKAELTTSF